MLGKPMMLDKYKRKHRGTWPSTFKAQVAHEELALAHELARIEKPDAPAVLRDTLEAVRREKKPENLQRSAHGRGGHLAS